MSTNVTAQTVVFLVNDYNLPLATILADTGIQSAQQNSLGQDVVIEMKSYYNFTTGTLERAALFLTFYVTPAFAATMVAGVAALVTRMATAAPNVTRIVTYGVTTVFN